VKGGEQRMGSTPRCPSSGVALIYFWGRVLERQAAPGRRATCCSCGCVLHPVTPSGKLHSPLHAAAAVAAALPPWWSPCLPSCWLMALTMEQVGGIEEGRASSNWQVCLQSSSILFLGFGFAFTGPPARALTGIVGGCNPGPGCACCASIHPGVLWSKTEQGLLVSGRFWLVPPSCSCPTAMTFPSPTGTAHPTGRWLPGAHWQQWAVFGAPQPVHQGEGASLALPGARAVCTQCRRAACCACCRVLHANHTLKHTLLTTCMLLLLLLDGQPWRSACLLIWWLTAPKPDQVGGREGRASSE
jgi:hypothetical protein